MAHSFERLDCVLALEKDQHCWTWVECETDDFSGCVVLMKPRILMTLPGIQKQSELIFIDNNRDVPSKRAND